MAAVATATSTPAIFNFAYFPGQWSNTVNALASAVETEDWTGNGNKNAILNSYILYTYDRLEMESKIQYTGDGNWATFNTGLLSPQNEQVFAFFERNTNQGRQPWFFKQWVDESNVSFMAHFSHPLPEMANFVNPPANLVYDMTQHLVLNTTHIMQNIARFPQQFQGDQALAIASLTYAKDIALKRLRRNYKLAVPQWYPASGTMDVQLLLPLDLGQTGTADLALVVSRMGANYWGNTVLTLDMAYSNARLVARPDSEWLKP